MPGMNGGELADKLVAMRPGLRVLFITGYDDEDVADAGPDWPWPRVPQQAVHARQLRSRVQALLADGAHELRTQHPALHRHALGTQHC